uniref:Transmembrane protein n=1 Tax=Panagrolaimus superbus TaxID=310955 RepID=A0A914Y181_9BILA
MNRADSHSQPPPAQWDTADPNSILPENTSAGIGTLNQSFQMGENSSEKLTGEQIDWLIKRLSTDDQQELGKILRECTKEMTLTRGLPFAALVTGGMYVARSRLPESLRFGPKRWPFYALIAVGALTSANLLSMNNCGQRVKPKMFEMYQKYTANQPNQTMTYESLRAANRQHGAQPYGSSSATTTPLGQEPQPYDTSRPSIYPVPQPPQKSGYLYEDAPTISGTPFSPTNSGDEPREKPTRGGGSYGDKGFS